MRLYELTQDFVNLKSQLEEYDLDPETFHSALEGIQVPIAEKAENIVKLMKDLEAEEAAYKAEADRLMLKANQTKKQKEYLKSYLDDNLKAAGIKELKAGVFDIKFRKGTEVVQVDDIQIPTPFEAPHLYIEQEPKFIGKADLKKLLKEGQQIKGVSLVRNPDSLVVK